jgi:4-amino-4-deoxy-L-arabinose transferase-like glycosyltransferase
MLLVILFGVSLLFRLLYFFEMAAGPYGNHLAMDSLYHDWWARQIASDKLVGEEAFFRAPLYPYVLGFIYFLAGNSLFAVKLIQMIIGSFSCLLIYFIAKRVFGKYTGLIAYATSACYSMF